VAWGRLAIALGGSVREVNSERQAANRAAAPRRWLFAGLAVCAALMLSGFGAGPALARHGHPAAAAAGYGPVFEWLLLDADTGQVLSEQNADVLTYPASLTKMMTLYLTFEALNQGRIRLDQPFTVSEEAASRAPSRLGLTPGESVPVRDLILGIVTKSANDAAAVLAEGLAGSEANFARFMTWKARQLGMEHTWYQNASGLPDPAQRTTARDVARLALALYHQFPREYRYFSTREFAFHGELVHGHNHLLDWYQGADGIKTGFINASGFNLAASAVRNGHRLIGVIMGGHSWHSRDVQMASLLDQGFALLAARQGAPQNAPQGMPLVAAAQPAAAPSRPQTAPSAAAPAQPPTPQPAAAPATPAPAAQVATATAPAAAPEPAPAIAAAQRAGLLSHVASAALRHLAPVGKAEAATLPAEAAPAGDDWAIQLGAFRGEAAAEQATRHVAGLALVRGKPAQIVPPGRGEATRLYRARLLHFTPKSAQAACAELHRRGVACTVIRPGGVKMASD